MDGIAREFGNGDNSTKGVFDVPLKHQGDGDGDHVDGDDDPEPDYNAPESPDWKDTIVKG